ncbi:unnamed protein product, partial [Pylaiella littoralis]
ETLCQGRVLFFHGCRRCFRRRRRMREGLPQLEAGVLQQEQLELHERRHVFEGAVGDDGSYHRQDSVRPRDHGRITRPG